MPSSQLAKWCCAPLPRRLSVERTLSLAPVVLTRPFSSDPSEAVKVKILDQQDAGVAIMTLNVPNKLNRMNPDMGHAFKAVVDMLKKERGLRAVVLTGAGRAFSAGGDMNFIQERCKDTRANNIAVIRDFYNSFLCIRDLYVPVITAINGPAIGAGMCLALATDYRFCVPRTDIGLTFKLAAHLHPGMGATHFLPKLVRVDTELTMLLTGETIISEDAAKIGALTTLSPDPVESALTFIHKVAPSSAGVRTILETVRAQGNEGLQAALEREAAAQADCYASPELAAKVEAVIKEFRARKAKREEAKVVSRQGA
eukprot:g39120.t1